MNRKIYTYIELREKKNLSKTRHFYKVLQKGKSKEKF